MAPDNGVHEAIMGIKERQARSEEDRREIWKEQGRLQERMAREEQRSDAFKASIDVVATKVDSLGKLAWGILVAVVLLLLGVVVNLAILVSQGGPP